MSENRGVVYIGQGKVEVQSISFLKLVNPRGQTIEHGVILKVVSTNICGSDQHMVRGHGHAGSQAEAPATVLNSLMDVTRVAGRIGIPGLYVTDDPGAADGAARRGSLSIRLGQGWAKSHSFFTGQTPVMKYNRQLMQAILWDKLPIAEVVGVQVIGLDQAPDGYAQFDAGAPKKFVIDPHKLLRKAA